MDDQRLSGEAPQAPRVISFIILHVVHDSPEFNHQPFARKY